ncbi:MAG TPA: molybdopterin biosynthesis protein [Anaerolineae bacterium]|nr:molybdopterin biosynthesis protein [Anaerolineae bacterium]
MTQKNIYLHDIPLTQAQARFTQALTAANLNTPLPSETIPLNEHALGRTTARAIWAQQSAPHYHASAMDGFAVHAPTTHGAALTNPLTLTLPAQATYLDTGDALPPDFNAVIPIENVEPLDQNGELSPDNRAPHAIRIRAAANPWQHVRPLGEDMVATQLVLPAGHTLRPADLGAIAGSGHHTIDVVRHPRVAIFPSGDELRPIGQPVTAGEIIEYNSLILAAQVNQWGGQAARFPILPDDQTAIRAALAQAATNHDLILLNAGSSAGSADFSADVIADLGQLLVHGIAVRPGHPVILGLIQTETKTTPIIGVPGYPVSAALTGEIFVQPLLAQWLGRQPASPPTITAQLTRKLTSPAGDDDYVRVAVGRVGDRTLAAPLTRGAGVISSLVRADGLAHLPRGSQGLPAGSDVTIHLYRSPADIAQTILAIGSHDLTLDLLAQFLAPRGRRLASANAGSLGGLIALRRREAHLAGAHLLDPDTGTYNHTYLTKYLPDTPVTLITLVGRQQGLIIPPGNPKGLQSLTDLTNPDIYFSNRQRGAGTRVLLDYHLNHLNIDPTTINGYQHEEYTHLAVAATVSSGRADCGLGIAAAAHALNLDFIPLYQERYDLVIPDEHLNTPHLAPLLDLLQHPPLHQAIAALPGYDTTHTGTIPTP